MTNIFFFLLEYWRPTFFHLLIPVFMVSILGSLLLYLISRRWVLAARHFDLGTQALIERVAPEPPPFIRALRSQLLLTLGLCGVLSLGCSIYGFRHPEKVLRNLVQSGWNRVDDDNQQAVAELFFHRGLAADQSKRALLAGPMGAVFPSAGLAHSVQIRLSSFKFALFLFAFFFILGLSAAWDRHADCRWLCRSFRSLFYRRYWKLISQACSEPGRANVARGSLQVSHSRINDWLRMGGPAVARFTTADGVTKRVMVAACFLDTGVTEGFMVSVNEAGALPWRAEGLFVPADEWGTKDFARR